MEYKLLNNGIIAFQNESGEWIYKANTLGPFKKNGSLKAQYKDLPRFKVIVDYEDQELKDFEQNLSESIKDISIRLLSFLK
jgi:hypothetical protein